MAKRKKKQYRKKFRGINVTNAIEAYSQVNVWSEAAFELSALEFIFKPGGGYSTQITAKELVQSLMGQNVLGTYDAATGRGSSAIARGDANAMDVIGTNLKDNWMDAAWKSVGLGVGWRLGRKATQKPRRYANKLLKDFGLSDMIRF